MKRLYDENNNASQGNRIYDIGYDAPTIARKNGGGVIIDDQRKNMTGVIQKTGGYCTTIKDDETGTLQSGGANVMDKVPNIVVQVKSATKDGYEEAKEGDSINFSMPNSKTRRGRVGVAQTLDTQVNQSVIVASRGRGENNEQSLEPNTTNTLTGVQKDNLLLEGMSIRRLTEIEVERLQGFEDNWTKYGNYDGVVKEISQTQRYKMCGNAVTVSVVELIGRKLLTRP